MLRALGHRVRVSVDWDGRPADLMLALHAKRSHDSMARFHARYPEKPILLALTGTDLYLDLPDNPLARDSLRMASAYAVLQEEALKRLTPTQRRRTVVVYQSADRVARQPGPRGQFQVCVVGHLREVKDPLRCGLALRHIDTDSRIRVLQVGGAMEPGYADAAQELAQKEPRYRWLGEVPHGQARKLMARSQLMVISSLMEGGANVVSEAIATCLPILASRMPGNVGMLGRDYPGYFPVGDERALARLMQKAESDPAFYRELTLHCRKRAALLTPAKEQASLKRWLELGVKSSRPAAPGSGARRSA